VFSVQFISVHAIKDCVFTHSLLGLNHVINPFTPNTWDIQA